MFAETIKEAVIDTVPNFTKKKMVETEREKESRHIHIYIYI